MPGRNALQRCSCALQIEARCAEHNLCGAAYFWLDQQSVTDGTSAQTAVTFAARACIRTAVKDAKRAGQVWVGNSSQAGREVDLTCLGVEPFGPCPATALDTGLQQLRASGRHVGWDIGDIHLSAWSSARASVRCQCPVARPSVRALLPLPQEASPLADCAVDTMPQGVRRMRVFPIGSGLAAPRDMHPCGQAVGARLALGFGGRFQRPAPVFAVVQGSPPFDGDRKRMQDAMAPPAIRDRDAGGFRLSVRAAHCRFLLGRAVSREDPVCLLQPPDVAA